MKKNAQSNHFFLPIINSNIGLLGCCITGRLNSNLLSILRELVPCSNQSVPQVYRDRSAPGWGDIIVSFRIVQSLNVPAVRRINSIFENRTEQRFSTHPVAAKSYPTTHLNTWLPDGGKASKVCGPIKPITGARSHLVSVGLAIHRTSPNKASSFSCSFSLSIREKFVFGYR